MHLIPELTFHEASLYGKDPCDNFEGLFFKTSGTTTGFNNNVDSKIYQYSNIGTISPMKFSSKL